MDLLTYCIILAIAVIAYRWGRAHAPANERLDRIKTLMREQNERVNHRSPDHQPLDYATMWVDIWVEVAPHEPH